MPCQVDTSYEDNSWSKAKDEHHKRVEAMLEALLRGQATPAETEALLHIERRRFANEYRRIYSSLISHEGIKEGMRRILEDKANI